MLSIFPPHADMVREKVARWLDEEQGAELVLYAMTSPPPPCGWGMQGGGASTVRLRYVRAFLVGLEKKDMRPWWRWVGMEVENGTEAGELFVIHGRLRDVDENAPHAIREIADYILPFAEAGAVVGDPEDMQIRADADVFRTLLVSGYSVRDIFGGEERKDDD